MPTRRRSTNLSVGEVLDRLMNDSDSNDEFEMSETELDDPSSVDNGDLRCFTPVTDDTPELQIDTQGAILIDVPPAIPDTHSNNPLVHPLVAAHVDVPAVPQVIEREKYDMADPYSPNWLGERPRRTGILVDTSDFSIVDYFKMFFPDELLETICTQTNLYATQYLDSHSDLPKHSRFKKWTPTSSAEIQAYIAIQIIMGLSSRPEIEDYWGTYWLTKNRICEVMSRNRYELLTSFLHFNNNDNRIPRGQDGYDALFKIRPMFDIVYPIYSRVYRPDRELALDESMIKFKGRIFFRQYMPAKPTKWGIKAFVLCESNSGYALKMLIYTGKGTFPVEANSPLTMTEQVVTRLTENVQHQGHILYTDKYYTSPNLFDDLVTCVMMDTKRVQFLSSVHTNWAIVYFHSKIERTNLPVHV